MNIANEFERYLKQKSLKYKFLDNSKGISFSLNGLNYLFQTQEGDSNYFRIILPNIDDNLDDSKRKIINELNTKYKVSKIIELQEERIWIVADAFVYSVEGIHELFSRMINLLDEVINNYRGLTKKEED